MEGIKGGTLEHLLLSPRALKYIPMESKKQMIFEIISGVQYIHSKSYCHRDLHMGNIMLRHNMIPFPTGHLIKIIDFGNAKRKEYSHSSSMSGSVGFSAPELLLRKDFFDCMLADVFSIGVISASILSGKINIMGEDAFEAMVNIQTGHYAVPDEIKGNARDLIQRMIEFDPKKRINAEHAMNHYWFKE